MDESSCLSLVGGKIVSANDAQRPVSERRRSCTEEARASSVDRERAPSARRSARTIAEHDYNAPQNQEPPPAKVLEIFKRFDVNGDGVLDATEVRAAVAHLGLALESDDAEALLTLHDTDKSGAIDLAELAAIVADLEELKAKQMLSRLSLLQARASIVGGVRV